MKNKVLVLFMFLFMMLFVVSCDSIKKVDEFTVDFIVDGKSYHQMVYDGAQPLVLPDTPTRENFVFGGWYLDKDTWLIEFTISYQIIGNITVYAKWIANAEPVAQHTVTFNTNGGSAIASIKVDDQKTLTLPTAPTKEGHTFAGWYTDSGLTTAFVATTEISGNITLYAKWTENEVPPVKIYVSFAGDTIELAPVEIIDGAIELPTEPEREGYTFEGWYLDEEYTEEFVNEDLTESITVYAKWLEEEDDVEQFTITYNSNGGSTVPATTDDQGASIAKPADPTKAGYTFIGWFINQNLSGTEIEFPYTLEEDVTFYAKWIIDSSLFSFLLDEDGYIISQLLEGNLTKISIPSEYEGKPVTGIGENAFALGTQLTSITIPDSIVNISSSAFSGCIKLESITLPFVGQSRNAIGNSANFGYVFGSDYYVGSYSANGFFIPSSLREVIITDDKNIISFAFSGCGSLKSIVISNSVTSISPSAFYGCSGLESITVPLVGVFGVLFGSDYYVGSYDANGYYIPMKLREVVVTNATSIVESAFEECSSLTSITIPNIVTSIGKYAFGKCDNLTSIVIPKSVTSIGEGAFYGCSSLAIITQLISKPNGWSNSWNRDNNTVVWDYHKTVEVDGIFYCLQNSGTAIVFGLINGSSLINVTIKDEVYGYIVMQIANRVFSGCSNLKSITIPSSVTIIGDYVFSGCSNLTSIVIPSSVTIIGDYVFSGCSNLTSVTFEENSQLSIIGAWAFDGCKKLSSITIPECVTSIGSYAFSDCSILTSITIPEYVTSIGEYAFSGCKNLISVTFGENSQLNIIGAWAFSGCSKITSIVIPDSVMQMGSSALSGCSSLQIITIPFVGLYGQATMLSSQFGQIFGQSSYTGSYIAKEFYIPSTLREVIITKSSFIIESAFSQCFNLTSIVIPDSVTYIGDYAFFECLKAKIYAEVSGPQTNWKPRWNYSGLPVVWDFLKIVEDDGVIYALRKTGSATASGLVYGTTLKEIVIKDEIEGYRVDAIGAEAFRDCSSLVSVTIPNSVTSIDYYAFRDCSSLTSIVIPSSVTSIGNSAFYECSKLTIYVEVLSKPSGWNSLWNRDNRPVYWVGTWHYDETGKPVPSW